MFNKKISSLVLCVVMLFCASISSYASTTTIEIIPKEISNGSLNEGITPYYVVCNCGGQVATVSWIERYGIRSCVNGYVSYDQKATKYRGPKCGSCGKVNGYTQWLGTADYCGHEKEYYNVMW